MGAAESIPDLRIVMLGKVGSRKSATGNTILGKEAFSTKMGPKSQCQKATGILPDGRTLTVINMPDFFEINYPMATILEGIKECVSFCSPGPHAIIQVIRLGHFIREDMEVAQLIQRIFSQKAKAYMIVLFPVKEDLEGLFLQELLSKADDSLAPLKEQIKSCGNRCLAFNNVEGKEWQDQVDELIRMMDDLARKNWPKLYYTNEIWRRTNIVHLDGYVPSCDSGVP